MPIGPLRPRHDAGHCAYDPDLDGTTMCRAPASTHILVEEGTAGFEGFTTFCCDKHVEVAHQVIGDDLTDEHGIGDTCLIVSTGRTLWRYSTSTSEGWCYNPDDPNEAVLVVSLTDELSR